MSPPNPDQNAPRPAFSWESVVGGDELNDAADDIDASELDPISLTIAPLSLEPLPPVAPPSTPVVGADETPPVLGDMHIGLPTIGATEPPAPPPPTSTPAVGAPTLPTAGAPPTMSSAGPTPASPPPTHSVSSTEPSAGPTPASPPPTPSVSSTEPSAGPTPASPPAPPVSPTVEPPAPPVIDAATAPGLDIGAVDAAPTTGFAPTLPTTGGGYVPRPPAVPVPEGADDLVDSSAEDSVPASAALRIEPMDVPDPQMNADNPTLDMLAVPASEPSSGEPSSGEVPETAEWGDGTEAPTTVLASAEILAPSLPGVPGAAPAGVPATSPSGPRAEPASRPGHESAPLTKKERKQLEKSKAKEAKKAKSAKPAKLKKQKKRGKHAPQVATTKPAKKVKSGRGGLALFFTLLVLVALIVAAIIFGRPYLFPDDWDPETRPYAEAVEAYSEKPIEQAVAVTRQPSATYTVTMTDELLGDWEAQAPMWRSFGLVDGAVDAAALREALAGWTGAYYSSSLGEVIVDDALTPAAVDGAIVYAMSLAVSDQNSGWASSAEGDSLAKASLLRTMFHTFAGENAAASSFGPALSERRLDKAEFMPPPLAYRVKAPVVHAAVITELGTDVIAPVLGEAAGAESLAPAPAPEVLNGDTILEPQAVDRAFWYLVFASYTDASTAYAASNALVESSLTTADRAGTVCSYATFAGTDVAGTERVAGMLQHWAATVPVEMGASYTVLADGTMQLVSCDPGAGISTGARFGTANELIRWRMVELAAMGLVDWETGTDAERTAAMAAMRQSQAATPLLGLPLDTSAEELAELAWAAAQPAG